MTVEIAAKPASEPWDLRDFVQNAPVGMHETGPDHRILWANQAELDLLGYTSPQYIGHFMSEFFESPSQFRSLLVRLHDRQVLTNWETGLRGKDGKLCEVTLSCNVHWEGSAIAGIRYIMRAVTDIKRSELELERRKDEIESLNQRLRRAMSETHHRVKNNLQIIAALVDMQLMANDGLIPANELRRVEHHIHALAAIHDLLTAEARKDPALESISVKSTLDVLRPLIQEMVGTRPVTFRVEDVRLPVRQETALALVVNELIANAARYGSGPIDLTLSVTNGFVTLAVCDAGPGFASGFDPSRYVNTGIELVETVSHWDLQGTTAYTNLPGGGAKVSVTFPVQQAIGYGR
jgi:PAS domain S-box-containing protein